MLPQAQAYQIRRALEISRYQIRRARGCSSLIYRQRLVRPLRVSHNATDIVKHGLYGPVPVGRAKEHVRQATPLGTQSRKGRRTSVFVCIAHRGCISFYCDHYPIVRCIAVRKNKATAPERTATLKLLARLH